MCPAAQRLRQDPADPFCGGNSATQNCFLPALVANLDLLTDRVAQNHGFRVALTRSARLARFIRPANVSGKIIAGDFLFANRIDPDMSEILAVRIAPRRPGAARSCRILKKVTSDRTPQATRGMPTNKTNKTSIHSHPPSSLRKWGNANRIIKMPNGPRITPDFSGSFIDDQAETGFGVSALVLVLVGSIALEPRPQHCVSFVGRDHDEP